MKILLAEDDPTSRILQKKDLEDWGYEVIVAEDGQDAWNLLQENSIRMVITDWMMPKMDGLAFCRKVRAAELSNYIYIILMTVKDSNEDLVSAFAGGADDFVTKPVNSSELRARVQAGQRIVELEETLRNSQAQLLQSEKMASIGQLAAGVAHEINNPTGFVSSNLKTLLDYQGDINELIKLYKGMIAHLESTEIKDILPASITEQMEKIQNFEGEIDLDYIMDDIMDLIGDCKEGTERIKKIVIDLKDFAHPGEDSLQPTDINKGIESTLNVVWNELKYKATVTKEYGYLPLINCYPQQLNQVFMNILVNAGQAIKERGEIWIMTRADGEYVEIKISDTGVGIPEENLLKIFEPFFTTKDVGKGTGLGMNVAYNIIKKHNGDIDVKSELGKGTTFTIRIPALESESST